jgi:AsmA protein
MKFFIKLFLSVIALLLITSIALAIFINPNDYKEQIQTKVKETINRDVLIKGDISWSFYPQLGFDFGEVEINNPSGFDQKHLLRIQNASVGLALLPLFKGEVQVGELAVDGLNLNLITNKDGSTNLDNLFPAESTENNADNTVKTKDKKIAVENTTTFNTSKIKLAGINIENIQIEMQDLQVNSITKAEIKHIKLGEFTPGETTSLSIITDLLVAELTGHVDLKANVTVAKDLNSVQISNLTIQTEFTGDTLPQGEVSSTITSNVNYDITTSTANIKDFMLQIGDINLAGTLSVQAAKKTKIRFTLQGNEWDVTPYLSTDSPTTAENTPKNTSQSTPQPQQEPDLSFLNDLDVQGKLTIAGIKANEINLGKINTNINIGNGKAALKPLTITLYEGLLTLNGEVNDAKGRNSYQLSSTLKDVQIHPLLIDATQVDLISGTTAFNFSAKGNGLTTDKIKSGLVGNGDFTLLDGELYGINIPQRIRAMKATLTGQAAPTEADIKKTDFASLTGQFTINSGIFNNTKLLMLSPVLRLDGNGQANLLQESLNYGLSVTPLSKSDADTDLADLNGITIPLAIKGTFTEPKFSLDTEGALKEKAKAKIEQEKQKLKEKAQEKIDEKSQELEDKLKSKLGKLFN